MSAIDYQQQDGKYPMNDALFQALMHRSGDAVLIMDGDRFIDCNEMAARVFCCPREELLSLHPSDVSPETQPDGSLSMEKANEMIRAAQEKGSSTFEWLHRRKNGEAFYADVELISIPFDGRALLYAMVRDITVRKKAEQELHEGEERYRTLVDHHQDGVFLIQDVTVQLTNPALAKITGYTVEEMQGMHFTKFVAPEDVDMVADNHRRRISGLPGPEEYVFRILHKDGQTRIPVNLRPVAITLHGRPAILGTVRNVTEKMQMQAALAESEQKFRDLFERSSDAMLMLDGDRFVDCNPATLKMMQCTREQLLNAQPQALSPEYQPDGRASGEKAAEMIALAFEKGYHLFEWVHRRPTTGENFSVEVSLTVIPTKDGQMLFTVWRDLLARKQVEAERMRLTEIVEATTDFVSIADTKAKLIYMNKSGRRILGFGEDEDLSDKAIRDVHPAWAAEKVEKEGIPAAISNDTWVGETALLSASGKEVPIQQTIMIHRAPDGQIEYMSTIGRDISERKALERQQQEMLERRGFQVQVSTEIAQEIASVPALEDLFRRVVILIKERFGYYHVQLLRYEEALNAVVLVYGYGDTGEKMVAAGHRMALGQGLIGVAAATGETTLRADVSDDPDWRANPLLPGTRGEIAVPIKYGARVLGVLDVQSDKAGALSEDDRLMLEGLCGQIAIAIDGTVLRRLMQDRLNELNMLYRATSREGWKTYRKQSELSKGFLFDGTELIPTSDVWVEEIAQAVQENRLVPAKNKDSATVAPLSVRGEVVGTIGVYEDPNHPLNSEDLAMIQEVSDQVAMALESARLFDQTRLALGETEKQAEKLVLLNDLGSALNRAGDAREAMRIALEKSRAILNADDASLTLFSARRQSFETISIHPTDGLVSQTVEYPVAETEVGKSVLDNRVFIYPLDAESKTTRDAEQLKAMGFHSAISAPLMAGNRLIGAMNLVSKRHSAYQEEDRKIMLQVASLLASTLENRRLFEQIQRTLVETEVLYNFSRSLTEARDLNELLRAVAEGTRIPENNRALLVTFDYDDQGDLCGAVIRANWFNGVGTPPAKVGNRYDKGMVDRIFKQLLSHKPVFVNESSPASQKHGVYSMIALPLWSNVQQFGVILVETATLHTYTDEEKRPIDALSQQASIAVQSRLLFEETQASEVRSRSTSERLSEALSIARMGYFEIDPTTLDFILNEQYMHVLGWLPEQFNGNYRFTLDEVNAKFFMSEDQELIAILLSQAVESQDAEVPIVLEMAVRREDGSTGYVNTHMRIVKDNEGNLLRINGASQDITERKLAQERLESESRKLQAVLDNMPNGVFMVEAPSGRPILSNRRAESFLGRGISPEAVGDTLNEVYQAYRYGTDELYPVEEMPVVAGMFGQSKTISDMEVRKPDGSQVLLEISGAPVKDDSGKIVASLVVFQDITERKLAQDTLESQRRTLQAVLDNMPNGVFMVEAPSGRPILSNRRAESFLGRGISPEAVGDTLNEIYQAYRYGTEELYPVEEMPVVAGMSGQSKTISDMEVCKPDGSRILLEVSGAPVKDDSGKIVASLVVFQDITERKHSEETLESQRRTLQAVLDNMPNGVFMVEAPSGRPILSNRRAESFLGRGISPEAVGDTLNEVYQAYRFGTEQLYPVEEMPIVAGMFGQHKAISDMEVRKPDGSRILLEVTGSPVQDSSGKIVASLVVFQDITERRRNEEIIAKRAVELATVSEVATAVATILSPDDMLQTVVDLTKASFDLYHTHIYLVNETGDTLQLAKGAGEVGRQMVSETRRIAINAEKSLVARAARTRQGVIVNDVYQDADFLPHPLLPDTRAEMAVPLVVGEALLGVLDVQSEIPDRFTSEDISIMTTLAAQVAVSLQNARSYARAQRQAEREALINAISERIQATNSVEDALQVAVRELGRALGAQRTAIQLGMDRKNKNSDQNV